ncbi:deletion of SUV3 suppressor 1(I) [Actinidia rufa]|uniref:26S proteasome complex subunit SEM1 n=1 Tax=Actinidia rufa TaxID=165716 RepID=A0A7J0DD54_9ERIC|nr:deletion of SUV3 suppressor 1(I) [Actinidia rufa]
MEEERKRGPWRKNTTHPPTSPPRSTVAPPPRHQPPPQDHHLVGTRWRRGRPRHLHPHRPLPDPGFLPRPLHHPIATATAVSENPHLSTSQIAASAVSENPHLSTSQIAAARMSAATTLLLLGATVDLGGEGWVWVGVDTEASWTVQVGIYLVGYVAALEWENMEEGKEVAQQWEDDWDDDDVNDDFSLQLRRELENNTEKK